MCRRQEVAEALRLSRGVGCKRMGSAQLGDLCCGVWGVGYKYSDCSHLQGFEAPMVVVALQALYNALSRAVQTARGTNGLPETWGHQSAPIWNTLGAAVMAVL
jgi:hypothetical protein